MGIKISIFGFPLDIIKPLIKEDSAILIKKVLLDRNISDEYINLLKPGFKNLEYFDFDGNYVEHVKDRKKVADIFNKEIDNLRGTMFRPIEGFTSDVAIFHTILEVLDPFIDKEDEFYRKVEEINKRDFDKEVEEGNYSHESYEKVNKEYQRFMLEKGLKSNKFHRDYLYIVPFKAEKPMGLREDVFPTQLQKDVLDKLEKTHIFSHKTFISQIFDLLTTMQKSGTRYLIYTIC